MQNNILKTINDNLCSGCGVCSGICPQQAISMKVNSMGFYEPEIDKSKCINCGICLNVCSGYDECIFKSNYSDYNDLVFGNYKNCYAAYSRNEQIRYNSSTAGFIRTFCSYYLNLFDGIITLTENPNDVLKPIDSIICDKDEIYKMTKSIYFSLERSVATKFLKENEGKYIIIGTPCQIASLNKARKYLKAEYFSIELFCGALYSLNLMKKYFQIKNCTPVKIDFRDKSSGWHNFSLSLYDNENLGKNNGTNSQNIIKTKANDDEFYYAQRNKILTMDRCLKCKLAHYGNADIMVGDFWGEKYKDNENGMNLVIARTEKADTLISNCKDIELEQCSITDVYKSQPWFVNFNRRNSYKPNNYQDKLLNWFNPKSLYSTIKINRKIFAFLYDKKNLKDFYNCVYTDRQKNYKKIINILNYLPCIKKNKILIIPPDYTFGSFGDQAMIISLIEQLKAKYPKNEINILMLNTYNDDGILQQYGQNVKIWSPNEYYDLDFLIKFLSKQTKAAYIIGADILDGGCGIENSLNYFSLIQKFAKSKIKLYTTGISFNKINYPEIVDGIKNISSFIKLNIRDFISFKRLKEIGCKNLYQVADIAFLFDETKYSPSAFCNKICSQIKQIKEEKKRIVGIHLTWDICEEVEFLEKICKILSQFKNVVYVLIPHDLRVYDNKLSDREMINRLENKFSNNNIEYINAFNLANETDVKTTIKYMDMVITSRMHLAIASFSRNVPVISFVYQGKFEGLYAFYDFKQNLMFEKNNFDIDKLKSAISYILDNNFSQIISERNKKVFELARKSL